jgi:hypothetical protein
MWLEHQLLELAKIRRQSLMAQDDFLLEPA